MADKFMVLEPVATPDTPPDAIRWYWVTSGLGVSAVFLFKTDAVAYCAWRNSPQPAAAADVPIIAEEKRRIVQEFMEEHGDASKLNAQELDDYYDHITIPQFPVYRKPTGCV